MVYFFTNFKLCILYSFKIFQFTVISASMNVAARLAGPSNPRIAASQPNTKQNIPSVSIFILMIIVLIFNSFK